MEQVQRILESQNIIPFTTLLDLGRKSLRNFFKDYITQISLDDVSQLWRRIHWTACSPAVADQYLTAACNALCVFLRCVCQSSRSDLRAFGFSEQVWFQGFEAVHKAFGDGKNKAAVQVLDTLIETLQEHEIHSTGKSILQEAIKETLTIVATGTPTARLKEACIILSSFLRKAQNLVPLTQYFEFWSTTIDTKFNARSRQNDIDADRIKNPADKVLGKILLALLLTASVPEAKTAAIKLFSLLCTKTEKIDFSQNTSVASSIIEIYLLANDDALEELSVDIFPAVLNDKDQVENFLTEFDPKKDFSTSRLAVYLAILQISRQKGFVTETDLPLMVNNALRDRLLPRCEDQDEYDGFLSILMCAVPTIRLQAFGLLTYSAATNAPVSVNNLRCLARAFKYLHDDTDTAYRDVYVGLARRLVNRLEKSGHALRKLEHDSPELSRTVLKSYTEFLDSWSSFLCLELSPQVSYQRHILALQISHLTVPLVKALASPLSSSSFNTMFIPALLSLLFDPFDDVRSQAGTLLIRLATYNNDLVKSILDEYNLVQLGRYLSANTNRADDADALGKLTVLAAHTDGAAGEFGAARGDGSRETYTMSSLISSVTEYVASISLFTTSSSYSLHGNLLGISYLVRLPVATSLKLDRGSTTTILHICKRVWTLVQADLCIDSPETEVEDTQEIGVGGPKDLLAYSWRALRDSSLLMQSLLDTQPPEHDLYQTIGDTCFDQLKRLRHRGAFSTVAQTFALCCHKCRTSNDELCRKLNGPWLQEAFDEIEQQSGKLTRRSAGLPSMFAALLDPTNTEQFLTVVRQLVLIAQNVVNARNTKTSTYVRLPQVHALNCLKDVMTNSRFRTITESLVLDMLILSSQCLSSDIWAIRNCGLMLFRASIDRLSVESSSVYVTHTTDIDPAEPRTPLAVALHLLNGQAAAVEQGDEPQNQLVSKQSEIVFAALDLLGRIPSQKETYKTIDECIGSQFSNKLWAVREHAARLKAMNDLSEDHSTVTKLLSPTNLLISANERHGQILCARYVLQRCWPKWSSHDKATRSKDILAAISSATTPSRFNEMHPMVSAAIFDVLNDLFAFMMDEGFVCSTSAAFAVTLQQGLTQNAANSKLFLFRCAYALNQAYFCVYRLHLDHPSDSRSACTQLILNIATDEPNVATYIIEELAAKLASAYSTEVFHVILHIASLSGFEQVRAITYLTLSDLLPRVSCPVEDTSLNHMVSSLNLREAQSRDLWNGQIRFAAAVLAYQRNCHRTVDTSLFSTLVSALTLSQQDDIESPTRFHAAKAIDDLIVVLVGLREESPQKVSRFLAAQIRMCVVLYNLLNDDDEEIRSIAAYSTYKLVRLHRSSRHIISGCAAAAREILLDFISTSFGSCTPSIASACVQVLGAMPFENQSEAECIVDFCRQNPVATMIRAVLNSANDLFAEERQNLYIDEIAQIEAWTVLFRSSSLGILGRSIVEVLSSWVIEGLDTISNLLDAHALDSSIGTEPVVKPKHTTIHPLVLYINNQTLTFGFLSTEILSHPAVNMEPGMTILVCLLVIVPTTVYGSWRFWKWYILQHDVLKIESGQRRMRAGMQPALEAPSAAPAA